MTTGPGAVDFRREYGALVASLSRRVGVEHLALAEDAASAALLRAVERWPRDPPRSPSAWLYRVALNHLISALRQGRRRRVIEDALGVGDDADVVIGPSVDDAHFDGEVGDDVLRLLFVCCDEGLPPLSQLVLALKVVAGFGIDEISAHLFQSPGNVYKRLSRARLALRDAWSGDARSDAWASDRFDIDIVNARRPAVLHVLYLMFTEGHLSAQSGNDGGDHNDDDGGDDNDDDDYSGSPPLRRELCAEALGLGLALARWDDARGQTSPETHALVALMSLHAARLDGRVDDGLLVTLDRQDRRRVDRALLAQGLRSLERAAVGDRYSRYHAEAAVVAEHAMAPSFRETRWDRIAEAYALWERTSASPLHTLNRAVAVAEDQGPEAGLAVLAGVVPPQWLDGSWMWSAVLADLHGRAGHIDEAHAHTKRALTAAPPAAIKAALTQRLQRHL